MDRHCNGVEVAIFFTRTHIKEHNLSVFVVVVATVVVVAAAAVFCLGVTFVRLKNATLPKVF